MYPNRYRDRLLLNDKRYAIVSIPLEHKTVPINRNQYTFDRKLGHGAYGTVYAARRHPDNMPVAIKVVSLAATNTAVSVENSESMLNEIRMAKRLAKTSEHIIHMYDFDFHNTGLSFFVMELGQQDLQKYLSEKPFVLSSERKFIWRQLVHIAITLHNHQIVHRDIKPQNLILFPGGIVKLCDLGIARKAYQNKSRPNGTPFYSAPEVTSPYPMTNITTKADVWSWGAVLYHMTYMTHPGDEPPYYYPPVDQRPTRDLHLQNVLRRTLVIDPDQRPTPSWFARHPYTRTY